VECRHVVAAGVCSKTMFWIIDLLAYGLLSLSLLCNRECFVLGKPLCYARSISIPLPPPCHVPPTHLHRAGSVERRYAPMGFPARSALPCEPIFSIPCCPRRMNVHLHVEVMQSACTIAETAQRCVEGLYPPISGLSRIECVRGMRLEHSDSEEAGSDAEELAADGNRHGTAGKCLDRGACRGGGGALGSAGPGGQC